MSPDIQTVVIKQRPNRNPNNAYFRGRWIADEEVEYEGVPLSGP
jgi:hypothetical protein